LTASQDSIIHRHWHDWKMNVMDADLEVELLGLDFSSRFMACDHFW